MTRFETAVEIAAPPAEVFEYAADPRRFPDWNSAVERVDGARPQPGAQYVMHRLLPAGPVTNVLEVVTWRPPEELVIRTTSGPTPFVYRYTFTADGAGTLIRLEADVRLGAPAALLGPLAAQAVRRGVDANLATLRERLERRPVRRQ